MYKIQRDSYEAAKQFLLQHSCPGFRYFVDEDDVVRFIQSLLTSLDNTGGSWTSCGGLLVMVEDDNYVSLYVEPKRWMWAIQPKARKVYDNFELV